MDHAAPTWNSNYTPASPMPMTRRGSIWTNCIETVQYEFRLYNSDCTKLLDNSAALAPLAGHGEHHSSPPVRMERGPCHETTTFSAARCNDSRCAGDDAARDGVRLDADF